MPRCRSFLLASVVALATIPLARGQNSPSEPRVRTDLYGDPLPEGALVRFGTTRFRHANGTSLAFAPDGKSLLTAAVDRTIRTWDAATGRLIRELHVPPKLGASNLVLSPVGRLVAYRAPD